MSPQRQGIKRTPQARECLFKLGQHSRPPPREIRKGMQRIELPAPLVPRPILPRILRVDQKTQALTELTQQRFRTRCSRHLRQVPHDLTIRRTRRPGACVEARCGMLNVSLPRHPAANVSHRKTHRMQQTQCIADRPVQRSRSHTRRMASPPSLILRIVIQLRAQAADRHSSGILQHRAVCHQITRRGKCIAARRSAQLRRCFRQGGAQQREKSTVPVHQPARPSAIVSVQTRAETAEVRSIQSRRLLAAHPGTREMAEHHPRWRKHPRRRMIFAQPARRISTIHAGALPWPGTDVSGCLRSPTACASTHSSPSQKRSASSTGFSTFVTGQ